MGSKTKNLQHLKERNINIHNFIEIPIENKHQAFMAIKQYFLKHKVFTIRGDCEPLKFCLPFLSIDNDLFYRKADIDFFIYQCMELGCSMLFSDGKQYDKIQTANVVVLLEGDNIKIETSGEKTPLRHMYHHPNQITRYSGKMSQNVREFTRIGAKPTLSSSELERLLNKIFSVKQVQERQFEMTVYPEKVGIFREEFIFWQII